jgi:hypothetical protein
MTRKILSAAIAALSLSVAARADVALHEFRPGERARAADVNGNFNSLRLAVEAAREENARLRGEIQDLETALATVLSLADSLTVESVNGVRTVRFSGVNLQVVNGTDHTETVNGAGNLIIGYDEPDTDTRIVCSRATNDRLNQISNEADCLAAGGFVAVKQKNGSHNLVMGSQNSYSSAGGIVAGHGNFVTAPFASSLGGTQAFVSGKGAVNVSGIGNHPTGENAATLAGASNTASGSNSGVTGGSDNVASSVGTSVTGGLASVASGPQSSVTGGIRNVASGPFSHVSGGGNNQASGNTTTVAGGSANDAQAASSSISGGSRNVTTSVVQVLP